MDKIVRTHEKILDYLLKLRKNDPQLYFVTRRKNNKKRLDAGYWFLGNKNYLLLSFWDGQDWKEKVHNIAFGVESNNTSWIELVATDSLETTKFLKLIISKIGGFEKSGSKNKWFKKYSSTDYLANLDHFIHHTKPIIDALIKKHKPKDIDLLDENFFNHYTQKIIDLRKEKINDGVANKISRICWNTANWKFPSGSFGKSNSKSSYEFINGFGHEEWIFDKSKIIDGYHYSFLQSLNLKTNLHVGKNYNISLFAINNLNKKYFIGVLKNVECISPEESGRIYNIYKSRGWLKEMETALESVGAKSKEFSTTKPSIFFNIRFKHEDAEPEDEPVEISDEDVNITTPRFKLLPQKADFIFNSEDENDDGDQGNKKNTNPRKKVFNSECEYDPYHDKMQNAIHDLLKDKKKYGYKKVDIEKCRVDLKAKTQEGKWHYFEIKTDSPKLSIRKAIGQIMEYSYFPDTMRAEKLIIIADEKPDANTLTYLEHIRTKFDLPVTYRHFNLETNILSEDY